LCLSIGFAALLGGCNENLQEPATTVVPDSRAIYDAGLGSLEFRPESPQGEASHLLLVASDITWDAETSEVHAWVALRNTGSETIPGPEAIHVSDFNPRDVHPRNATCPFDCDPSDPIDCPWLCFYEHAGTYGGDGVLEPGETSEPVEWILFNPSGESFAFRARLGEGPDTMSGEISGFVFEDQYRLGERSPNEPGVEGELVRLLSGDSLEATRTDARGRYRFRVTEPGLYELVWLPSAACDPTTPTRLQVVILRRPDGSLSSFTRGNFGCRGEPAFGVPVEGSVYVDANRNGRRDSDEVGIPNVLVMGASLQCPTFVPIQARTDERGHYSMRLPACDPPWEMWHEPLSGYVDTSPNPLLLIQPPPPGGALRADFGVVEEGTTLPVYNVEGTVFLDGNRDGVRDPKEPGVEGVDITGGSLICAAPFGARARTDAFGRYTLRGEDIRCPLPWMVQRHGTWVDTTPNSVILTEPPADGSDTFQVDFGVAPRDSVPEWGIAGVVFHDLDGDGVHNPNEPGIADVAVQLLSPCEVLRLVRTNEQGQYFFPPDVVGVCPVTGVWE
jgi:hypothetical protein